MLVRKIDGVWQEWRGRNDPFTVTVDTVRIVRDDDANSTTVVPVADVGLAPYTRTVMLSAAGVEAALKNGAWGPEDLARFGLAVPVPFAVPDGKRIVAGSLARYEEIDGVPHEAREVEDIPPPPPPPTREEKFNRLLSDYGLSREEFKAEIDAAGEVMVRGP